MSHPILPLSGLQSAVFLLNSPSHHFSVAAVGSYCTVSTHRSVPSPEVTVQFCLVPSPGFFQAPWYPLPDHLCRSAVRPHSICSLVAFPGSLVQAALRLLPRSSRLSVHQQSLLTLCLPTTFHQLFRSLASPASFVTTSQYYQVREFLPVSLRLRFSASP